MKPVDLFEKIVALDKEGRSFAVATVVSRRTPVSAHLGDRAIIFSDGTMEGFVGGACSREIVRKQALEAIRCRSSRLVSIRPEASEAGDSTSERVVVPMTCASEGAIDVYIEPNVPPRRIVVVGATPVAESVARLACSMDYDVLRAVDRHEKATVENATAVEDLAKALSKAKSGNADQAAIVASQGHYDEEALEIVLKCGVPYVGLVASRKRGATIREMLEQRGVPGVDKVRIPAGIDLGARTPPEVALSILAEIVILRPSAAHQREHATPDLAVLPAPASATAVDPVCGMQVDIANGRHTATVDNVVFYFCCAHCRAKFLQDPAQYRTAAR